jgi:hypothetical protein
LNWSERREILETNKALKSASYLDEKSAFINKKEILEFNNYFKSLKNNISKEE